MSRKCFKRYAHPGDRLKEILLPGKSRADEFWALQDINLEVPKGQTLGIIGRNGCGKSTLLQIIVGTLTPTTGQVITCGRVSALLELGSGFNPEFTGRQNVFFNGRLLGLSQKEIEDKFDEIAGFADIGDFIEQPVKTYSSGMFVRLAFAVAVNVSPEILIVDEALAVGDVVFQHRCMRRMRALMDSGVTTLFVSHDSGAIKTLCNSAVMLHQGKIHSSGLPNAVIIDYMKLVTEEELGLAQIDSEKQPNGQANNIEKQNDIAELLPTSNNGQADNTQQQNNSQELSQANVLVEQAGNNGKAPRRGNRKAFIENVKLLNRLGEYTESPIFGFNEEVTLILDLEVYEPLQGCIIGFFICNKNGVEIIGSNTLEENFSIGKLEQGDTLNVEFKFKLPLKNGSYSLTVAGSENYTAITFDWIDNVLVFQVLPPDTGKNIHALIDHPMVVKVIKKSLVNVAF
jgi:lipopolysaccharide transport system ATP-binding protein